MANKKIYKNRLSLPIFDNKGMGNGNGIAYVPNIIRGGSAIPIGNNMFFMKGKSHSQGGIDIGKDLEVEKNEVVQNGKFGTRVFSSVPFLRGVSPAERVLQGENPDAVFAAQENWKRINKINDDGSRKARKGKYITNPNVVQSDNTRVEPILNNTPKSKEIRQGDFIYTPSQLVVDDKKGFVWQPASRQVSQVPLERIYPEFDAFMLPRVAANYATSPILQLEKELNKGLRNVRVPNKSLDAKVINYEPKVSATKSTFNDFTNFINKPVVKDVIKDIPAYQIQRYPGYMLKSLMEGNPLEKQLSKVGTISVNSIKAQAAKSSNIEKSVIDKILSSEQFAGQKAVDYNNFRKAVQDELITYNRKPQSKYSTYGMDRLGFNVVKEPDGAGGIVEYTPDISTRTFTFESPRIGIGSNKHYDYNTLGHSRTYVTKDEPNVLHVMESQSDWAQKGIANSRAKVINAAKEKYGVEFEDRVNGAINRSQAKVDKLKNLINSGVNDSGEKLTDWQKEQLKNNLISAKEELERVKSTYADVDSQELYLSNNYTSRQIQENLRYAAENGQTKMRYPTRDTAAKIENYTKQQIPTEELKAKQQEISKIESLLDGPSEIDFYDGSGFDKVAFDKAVKEYTKFMNSSESKVLEKRLEELRTDAEKMINNLPYEYPKSHETILRKYDSFPKEYKKLYKNSDINTITDSKGNTWYEVDVPKDYLNTERAYKFGGRIKSALGLSLFRPNSFKVQELPIDNFLANSINREIEIPEVPTYVLKDDEKPVGKKVNPNIIGGGRLYNGYAVDNHEKENVNGIGGGRIYNNTSTSTTHAIPRKNKYTEEEIYNQRKTGLDLALDELNVPFKDREKYYNLLIPQSVLEPGWTIPSDNNYFGHLKTVNGKRVKIKYNNPKDAWLAHIKNLNRKWPSWITANNQKEYFDIINNEALGLHTLQDWEDYVAKNPTKNAYIYAPAWENNIQQYVDSLSNISNKFNKYKAFGGDKTYVAPKWAQDSYKKYGKVVIGGEPLGIGLGAGRVGTFTGLMRNNLLRNAFRNFKKYGSKASTIIKDSYYDLTDALAKPFIRSEKAYKTFKKVRGIGYDTFFGDRRLDGTVKTGKGDFEFFSNLSRLPITFNETNNIINGEKQFGGMKLNIFKLGGLSRSKDYGSKDKPYPSVNKNDFAGGGRSYPIPTRADAVDALRLAGLHHRSDVRAKVYAKYPDLRKKAVMGTINDNSSNKNNKNTFRKIFDYLTTPGLKYLIDEAKKPSYKRVAPSWITRTESPVFYDRNVSTKKGNFGNGRFSGGGAGTKFFEEYNPVEEVKRDTIFVPYETTFNDAFSNARRKGLKEFDFNGKKYNTELGDNPKNYEAGQQRKSLDFIPFIVERKKKNFVSNNEKKFGGKIKAPIGTWLRNYFGNKSFKRVNSNDLYNAYETKLGYLDEYSDKDIAYIKRHSTAKDIEDFRKAAASTNYEDNVRKIANRILNRPNRSEPSISRFAYDKGLDIPFPGNTYLRTSPINNKEDEVENSVRMDSRYLPSQPIYPVYNIDKKRFNKQSNFDSSSSNIDTNTYETKRGYLDEFDEKDKNYIRQHATKEDIEDFRKAAASVNYKSNIKDIANRILNRQKDISNRPEYTEVNNVKGAHFDDYDYRRNTELVSPFNNPLSRFRNLATYEGGTLPDLVVTGNRKISNNPVQVVSNTSTPVQTSRPAQRPIQANRTYSQKNNTPTVSTAAKRILDNAELAPYQNFSHPTLAEVAGRYPISERVGSSASITPISSSTGNGINPADVEAVRSGNFKAIDNDRYVPIHTTTEDWVGLGANLLGSIGSYLGTRAMLNRYPMPSKPVPAIAQKLKTRFNINSALDQIREQAGTLGRMVDNNVANSRVAQARKQGISNNATASTNQQYNQKENIETQLINQDIMNRQRVGLYNNQVYNNWLSNRDAVRRYVAEGKIGNFNNVLSNTNQAFQDLFGRIEGRNAVGRNLIFMQAAYPNVNWRNIFQNNRELARSFGFRFV